MCHSAEGGIDKGGGCACVWVGGMWEISVPSHFSVPKTDLKTNLEYKKNKNKSRGKGLKY